MMRCAVCHADGGPGCTGEDDFLRHINGNKHAGLAQRGAFLGLLPNMAGVIPRLTLPKLIAAKKIWECSKGAAAVRPASHGAAFSGTDSE